MALQVAKRRAACGSIEGVAVIVVVFVIASICFLGRFIYCNVPHVVFGMLVAIWAICITGVFIFESKTK